MNRLTVEVPSQSQTPAIPASLPLASLIDFMFAEAVNQHGNGKLPEAEALYRAVLALQPLNATAYYNVGLTFYVRGMLPDAITAYRNAILIRRDYIDAYGNLGAALGDIGSMQDAIEVYRQALLLKPDYALVYCNLATPLKALGKLDTAVKTFQNALSLDPAYEFAFANFSAVLMDQGKVDDAITACIRATKVKPDMAIGYFNLGTAYKAVRRLDEAVAAFREALRCQPGFVEAHFSLAQTLLLQGAFEEGWDEYEWRWKLGNYKWLSNIHGEFAQPRWSGEEDLKGKRILLYAEQGLGDSIQYVRYAPMLAERGVHVILAVHPPLTSLFETIPGIEVVALNQIPLPPFDFHFPLLSLPKIFKTRGDNIPATVPYLRADPAATERWQKRVGDSTQLRVGVVWAGNPTQTGDRFRSPRLAAVQPLFSVPGVTFVALQVGAGRADMAEHPLPSHVVDLGEEINDFSDTAAIMAGLDLVISSCTSPLHQAGALGIPVWGMIPFSPHFAWLMERRDSPWYPSLRLYRQDQPGQDWSGVVERIAKDLKKMVKPAKPRKS